MRYPLALLFSFGISVSPASPPPEGGPLTIIAIGDAGENNSVSRGCGNYITNMWIGQHDAGTFQALLFLGDNFYPTGLNIPADDVAKKVETILEPFKTPMEGLGPRNVHALAGNHDYYARHAIETSVFFGLVKIEEAPMGLTDRGNRREGAIGTWSYYSGMPAQAVYPLEAGSSDSVQLIFYDSALPLRTPPALWSQALDSLRRILRAGGTRPGILWRLFCAHHPFVAVGEHAGYTEWDDETSTVGYLTPCDRDSNAIAWLKNSFDPEDLCTDRYRAFVDSVRSVIRSAGVKVQIALGGHDHSLQLLSIPSTGPATPAGLADPFPAIQIVSGAGALPTRVKFPSPPASYTSARPSGKGESLPGFVQLRFGKEKVRIVFYNANNGDPIDMGEGTTEFWVSVEGKLIR